MWNKIIFIFYNFITSIFQIKIPSLWYIFIDHHYWDILGYINLALIVK